MKASVLCRLPNQRERLKHYFVGAKPAGVPTASPMSAFLNYFLLLLFEAVGISHTKGASEMTISKRCDVPSCFLFGVVASHVCVCVCVCVREPVVCFCFEDGITNVYVSKV